MSERGQQPSHMRVRLASLVLVALVAACAPAPTRLGDTHVGRGQLYRAGRADYDTFFAETHDVQLHAMQSIDEERRARAPVEQAMGGTPAPSASALADRIVARDRENPPASPARDPAFAQALSASLQSEASVAKKYDPVATRASQLSVRADELLASSDHDFARARERDEVARELSAAKLVLSAAALRTRTVANDAQAFVNVASKVRKVPEPAPAPVAVPAVTTKTRKRPPRGKDRIAAAAPREDRTGSGNCARANSGAAARSPCRARRQAGRRLQSLM